MPQNVGPRSRPGRKPPGEQYNFGTPEEINNRVGGQLFSQGGVPDLHAPSFEQIRPQASTGRSVNRANPEAKGGPMKFSKGPGSLG